MIWVKWRLLKEQMRVIGRYYGRGGFFLVDAILFFLYFFTNPYRICRKFLEKKGAKNVYCYGETPLTALEMIVRAFGIRKEDRWLDLGSGRGRGCFWLSAFWGCSVRGVEWIPEFVLKASKIVSWGISSKVNFYNSSMEEADFSWPTVVYLCGTCMSDEEIHALLAPMQRLRKGAKVITISEPLHDSSYKVVRSIPVSFIWGNTDAYLHVKINDVIH